MKKLYKILIIVAVVLLALGFAKDFIIKSVVEMTASRVLGTSVHIGGMSVGLFKQSVRISNLRINNPPGFPSGILMDIPAAGVDYDLGQIMKGNLHLPLLILNLKELNLVRNKEGKLNVDALKVAAQGKNNEPKKEDAQNKEKSSSMPMQIDVVVLNLGKVTVKDYSKLPMVPQTLDIGVKDKTYKNIKSAQQLVVLVLVEAMKPTAFREAAIYGAAAFLGVAFLPVGVADVLWHHFSPKTAPF